VLTLSYSLRARVEPCLLYLQLAGYPGQRVARQLAVSVLPQNAITA